MAKVKSNRKPINFMDIFPLVLSFMLPIMIMIIIFISRRIYPFGDRSFLRTDLYHQYAPFLSEMADKLQHGESLLYSWDIGAGTNFIATYTYYLASPFNWILFLIPHEFIIEYLSYMVIFKIGLCGLTFAIYLRESQKVSKRDFGVVFFAIFYAMSGYIAAYSWNIMWMDCMFLFPLVVLGVEKLFKEDKCFLYCISLALCILSNYYISIMICIFLVLYSVVLMITIPSTETTTIKDEEGHVRIKRTLTPYWTKFLRFGLFSVLAGAIAAVTLLPEIYALRMTASSDSTFPTKPTVYFSIFEMLSRHLMPVETHQKLDHWPNIYCGVGVFLMLPLYIMNKRISYKEKFMNFLLAMIMLVSFGMNIPNYIWHGMHYPNSLPARQSFIYIFLILAMCYKGYQGIKERSTNQIVGATVFGIGFTVLAEFLIDREDFGFYTFYASILFMAFYGLFAFMYRKKKILLPILLIAATTFVSMEAAINMTVTSISTFSRTTYTDYDEAVKNILTDDFDTSTFYRVEKRTLRTRNDGAWLDYPSISTFSSMSYKSMTDFYRLMGMESSTNAYGSHGMTPVVEGLFGVKYILYKSTTLEENPETELYSVAATYNDVFLYQNNNSLSIGYMIPSAMNDDWVSGSNPVDNQTTFIKHATGVGSLYTSIDTTIDGKNATAEIPEDGYYYAYVTSSSVKELSVSVGNITNDFSNVNRHYIIDLGYRKTFDHIAFSTKDDVTRLGVSLYRLDESAYRQAMENLASQQLNVTDWRDNILEGNIHTDNDGTLMLTVPYDKGWSVIVDGAEIEPELLFDTFIGIPLSAGDHTISMKYTPQGLKYGAILSGLALLLLLLLFILTKLRYDPDRKVELTNDPIDSKILASIRDSLEALSEEYSEDPDDTDEADIPDESLKDFVVLGDFVQGQDFDPDGSSEDISADIPENTQMNPRADEPANEPENKPTDEPETKPADVSENTQAQAPANKPENVPVQMPEASPEPDDLFEDVETIGLPEDQN